MGGRKYLNLVKKRVLNPDGTVTYRNLTEEEKKKALLLIAMQEEADEANMIYRVQKTYLKLHGYHEKNQMIREARLKRAGTSDEEILLSRKASDDLSEKVDNLENMLKAYLKKEKKT
jgi:hypothetical protein